MAQGMASDVKGEFKVCLEQYFFKVVLHGADRQAIAFFGGEKGFGEPAVQELIADGKIVADNFDQLVVYMQRAGFAALSHDGDFGVFVTF